MTHSKTVRESYYIETGKLQIKYLIGKRRLMYLWHILSRDQDELISKVYMAQSLKPTNNDWFNMIQKEKIFYEIHLTDEQISGMTRPQFKKIVDDKVNKKSLLLICQTGKSKVSRLTPNIQDGKVVIQPYLTSTKLSTEQKQQLFSLRCRNFNVKSNYKTQYSDDMTCRICCDPKSYENEIHTFQCEKLLSDIEIEDGIKFDDIFGNLESQIRVMNSYIHVIRKRNVFLEIKENRK